MASEWSNRGFIDFDRSEQHLDQPSDICPNFELRGHSHDYIGHQRWL
jgi:hypothetical protein